MKRRIRDALALACLFSGLCAVGAVAPRQMGRPITDAEAATLQGGTCGGTTTKTCDCGTGSVTVSAGTKDATTDPTGDSSCCAGNNTTSCFFRATTCYH